MKALLILFLVNYVGCSQNSEGNNIEKELLRPESDPLNQKNDDLVHPSPRAHMQLNQGWISSPSWNTLGRSGLVPSLFPGMTGLPPPVASPFLFPAPAPILLPPNAILGVGNPYSAFGLPIMGIITPLPYGNTLGQSSLVPSGPIRAPFGGFVVPISTTTTVQTEEVAENA